MIASTVYSAESPSVQSSLSWLEFGVLGLMALAVSVLALIAPRRGRRPLIVTDLLR